MWLYRLADPARFALSPQDRSSAVAGRSVRGPEGCRASVDGSGSPLLWLLRDERQRIVQAAIARLPPRDAEVLILKYSEGLGSREIAERLGVAVATIETRLHRARGRLRAELSGLAAEFEARDHE